MVNTMISPGLTSLTNVAPTEFNAHVSLDITYSPLSRLPKQSGCIPFSSRTAIIFCGDIISKEYAPLSLCIALQTASSMDEELIRSIMITAEIISASLPV